MEININQNSQIVRFMEERTILNMFSILSSNVFSWSNRPRHFNKRLPQDICALMRRFLLVFLLKTLTWLLVLTIATGVVHSINIFFVFPDFMEVMAHANGGLLGLSMATIVTSVFLALMVIGCVIFGGIVLLFAGLVVGIYIAVEWAMEKTGESIATAAEQPSKGSVKTALAMLKHFKDKTCVKVKYTEDE